MITIMIPMNFQNREPVCEPVHAHVPVLLERICWFWEDLCENQKHNLRLASSIILYYVILHYIMLYYVILWYPEYVMQHWREDFMFGYQFLNGCNPVMIQKCTKLPDKFPVTNEMVSVSLERELTLEQEIEVDTQLSISLFCFLWISFPKFHSFIFWEYFQSHQMMAVHAYSILGQEHLVNIILRSILILILQLTHVNHCSCSRQVTST